MKRTPLTSAERQLVEAQRMREPRWRGHEPTRLPLENGYAPLLLDGALPPGHPLETPQEDRRRLRRRMAQESKGHR